MVYLDAVESEFCTGNSAVNGPKVCSVIISSFHHDRARRNEQETYLDSRQYCYLIAGPTHLYVWISFQNNLLISRRDREPPIPLIVVRMVVYL